MRSPNSENVVAQPAKVVAEKATPGSWRGAGRDAAMDTLPPPHTWDTGGRGGVPIAVAFVNRFDSPLFLVTEQTFLVTKLMVFGGGIRSDY